MDWAAMYPQYPEFKIAEGKLLVGNTPSCSSTRREQTIFLFWCKRDFFGMIVSPCGLYWHVVCHLKNTQSFFPSQTTSSMPSCQQCHHTRPPGDHNTQVMPLSTLKMDKGWKMGPRWILIGPFRTCCSSCQQTIQGKRCAAPTCLQWVKAFLQV